MRSRTSVRFGPPALITPVIFQLGALGAESAAAPDESDTVVLRRVDQATQDLLARAREEDSRKKITLALTVAGVVFAAFKLGIVTWAWRTSKHVARDVAREL